MTTKFWQCRNCLDFFQAKDLTITEYITIDLKKVHIAVCQQCLKELEESGFIVKEPALEKAEL